MGALLAFQPAPAGGRSRLPSARAWIERAKGLRVLGENPEVVKFARLNGTGAGLATSAHGWLVSAGSWHHPACGRNENEALLARAEAEGTAAFDGLDGCFAVLWSDARNGRLTVVPDHFGRLHVYAAEAPEGVYLGTSPVALAAAARRGPDPLAAWEFLAVGTHYEDRSPFAGVRRLAGACRHRFRGGRAEAAEPCAGWLLPPRGPTGGGASAEEYAETLLASLRAFLDGTPRPLSDLTGGVDSRLLAGFLLEAGLRFDATVMGEPRDRDVRVAEDLARRLGLTLQVVPRTLLREAHGSFPAVLAAAARTEGLYDAVEYAGIAAIHGRNAREFDLSINGSGGEVTHWYSWNTAANRRTGSAERALLHRFTGLVIPPRFLDPRHAPDPSAHFRAVFARALGGREADPIGSRLDHLYLHLRMQCWQGALASATGEFWESFAPLLLRRPLEVAYRIPDGERFGNRLLHTLFRRFGGPLASRPLDTGRPPLPPGPRDFWRHLPALVRAPAGLWTKVRRRLARGKADPATTETVRALMASGAADYLDPATMALSPLCDGGGLESFVAAARRGAVPLPLLGRLLALEYACREAARGS